MSSPVTQEQKNRVRRRLTFDSQDTTSSTSDSIKHPINTHPPSNASATTGQLAPSEDPQRPEEPSTFFSDEMTQQQKREKMQQWNFDFENEVPLPGSWEWVMVPRPRTTDHKEAVKSLEMEKAGFCDDRNV